jgi:GNAT superfamily N-acetyltransferase
MDDHAVVTTGDGSTVVAQIESRTRQLGRACFAEQFVAGREFNLSLIAVSDGPRVLPPAEIDFSAFPPNKPKIVGYAAKWVEGTFEFVNTPRKFEFAPNDAPLLDWLRTLAVECWHAFDLRGYARVDFRVDSQGQPWILEINANPCLAPDAGFAAALARAGISLEQAVVWIVDDVQRARRTEPRVKGQEAGSDAVGNTLRGVSVAGSGESGIKTPAPTTHHSPLTGPPRKKSKRAAAAKLRTEVQPADRAAVRRIVESTGLFRPAEIDVAVELVEARLTKGAASGYEFAFAEQKGELVGYACFGRNTLTVSSFDLYWIAVEKSKQGDGIGRLLLEEAERQITAAGGGRIYIETSQRPDYQATRGFYDRCGYKLEAVLEDFYASGDSKAIYVKALAVTPPHAPALAPGPSAKT